MELRSPHPDSRRKKDPPPFLAQTMMVKSKEGYSRKVSVGPHLSFFELEPQ